jgi:hypothetical protein
MRPMVTIYGTNFGCKVFWYDTVEEIKKHLLPILRTKHTESISKNLQKQIDNGSKHANVMVFLEQEDSTRFNDLITIDEFMKK